MVYRGSARDRLTSPWWYPTRVKAYLGFDWRSDVTRRVLRDFQKLMSSTYGLAVDIDILELPVGETDSEAENLPVVYLGDRLVAAGEVPSISQLVESAFRLLEDTLPVPKISGFPILETELEE